MRKFVAGRSLALRRETERGTDWLLAWKCIRPAGRPTPLSRCESARGAIFRIEAETGPECSRIRILSGNHPDLHHYNCAVIPPGSSFRRTPSLCPSVRPSALGLSARKALWDGERERPPPRVSVQTRPDESPAPGMSLSEEKV